MSGQGSFCFAVISDPHCAEEPHWKAGELGSHLERLKRCLDRLMHQDREKPDFVMLTGDIHLREARAALDPYPVRFYMLAGNHETKADRADMRTAFPEDFQIDDSPSDYYHFVHKGVRFIALCNAGAGGDHVGHLDSEGIIPPGQCAWLRKQLSGPESMKILFAHIPPAYDGIADAFSLAENDSRFLIDQIRTGRLSAAFFGHRHQAFSVRHIHETPCYTLPSCAWNLDGSPPGMVWVAITGNQVRVEPIGMEP